ncbi:metalloregulator ArsR/SmtB family transcription factor [Rhizobium sp. BE258]|jgi:DNA-binding transcriptional ArsR family regulator|uniref:ArsR/SmtB family transcription factor n=1 Tax=Rhizobium sp. BE258 TaxID=2817722 RepID=UPI002859271E|nr:metalloregulator ArsR/SmtB family transcription factor [Rhizobium sp. BE258]MDR7145469.1 DNA-binding transcriptional ArsR family regulator [Rhizobium sp. BE258]
MIAEDTALADYLSALANSNRLAVLRTLADGEASVKQLAACVGLSRSALSQHLAILRRQKLVATRRDARTIFYSLSNQRSEKALSLVNKILFPYGIQMSLFGF